VSARRLAQAFLLALAALLASACATTTLQRLAYANATLFYNNLGPVLTWMVDGYVDLSAPQESWVRARIARALAWHRAHELPEYRRLLEAALAKTAGAFEADDVAPIHRELRASYRRVLEQVIPDMAELLSGLGADQVAQLERKFADDNRRFERESLRGTPEERLRKRMHKFIDHLEGWMGTLDAAQRDLVAAQYREVADLSAGIMAERRYRQGEILALLRANPPREEMAAQLRRLLVEADSWRRPEYAEQLKARDRRMFEMLAALSATLSSEQRNALQARIRGFLRDISTLTAASRGGASAASALPALAKPVS
jgi:hypothetical protein